MKTRLGKLSWINSEYNYDMLNRKISEKSHSENN